MKHREVRNLMTTNVVTVHRDTPFKEIAQLLAQYKVSGVPVLDPDNTVIGVVSEADLLRKESAERLPVFAGEKRRRAAEKAAGRVAADVMTAPAITIEPEATVVQAAKLLAKHDVKRLPVVDSDGILVGIVSRRDLLKVFLRSDDELREEILHDVFERTLWVDRTECDVEAHDGIVRLRGQLETKSLVSIAVSLTRKVDGVIDVVDLLSYDRDDNKTTPTSGSYVDIAHRPWSSR